MKRLCLILLVVAGCKKQQEAPPAPPPAIPAAEVQRGRDACRTYVAKVCQCAETVAAAKDACSLGKAYPEAIDIGMQTVANTNSKSDEVKSASDMLRKTMATCIEETAKLPVLGCPP